jgi:hypothetical protein
VVPHQRNGKPVDRLQGHRGAVHYMRVNGWTMSPKILDVWRRFADGQNVKQAAESIGVTESAIEFRRAKLFRIVGTNSLCKLGALAVKHGITKG